VDPGGGVCDGCGFLHSAEPTACIPQVDK